MKRFWILVFGFSFRRRENKRVCGLASGALILFVCFPSAAQQSSKLPRIGFLTYDSASATALRLEAFRQGLRELGYVEGKNIIVEQRYAEGKFERLTELAEDLARLNVDIFVVPNDATARAVKKTTPAVPIVMTSSGNPIGTGVIASLPRPGGNVTGLTSNSPELLGKRLELLKEVVPNVSRVAFLNDSIRETSGASKAAFEKAQLPAKILGVQLQSIGVKAANPDFERAFQVMTKERIGALITSPGPVLGVHRKKILELAERNRIPAIHPTEEWVSSGGLMSYSANGMDLIRRAAIYVDKILKGAKPGDLPVEQPTKFDLLINLKAAKQIGITIPPHVLARADRVIK